MLNREQSIKATFDIFHPNDLIEVRSLDGYTASGYFKDHDNLYKQLMKQDNKTWYVVMNEINDACYSREQSEKILSKPKIKTTGDTEITSINWILIDADPVRPAGVSSTDDEKEKAHQVMRKVYKFLRQTGFSEPIACDSGNGYHLLYSVKINPAVETDTVKNFLKALDMLFSNEYVSIDTAVFNPSRITKVYGTVARKGANTKERPWRTSGIISIPEEIKKTSISLINKVCEALPKPQKPSYSNNYTERFDIDSFIFNNGIQVHSDKMINGVRKIVLENCPFDHNHAAPDSAIFVMDNGAIAFKCFHNSCKDYKWQDLRQKFDPMCYERKQEQNRCNSPTTQVIKPIEEEPKPVEDGKEHFLRLLDVEPLDRSKIITIKTGIAAMDKKIIGMNKGEMSIWSGGNGSGKSTFLSQLALETIEKGFNVAMFSGELTSNRTKLWLQLQAAGRQNVRLSDNGVSYYVPKKIASAIDEWAADKLWIYDNQYGLKINNVLDDFKRHIEAHKTDVVIIDNLMSLDLNDIKGEKYDRQTSLALCLSALAKQYNVHIHFVCHPRKPTGFLRKSDISGTADLTNAADNVFMLHRVNKDFQRLGGEFLGKQEIAKYMEFTNVIEIMKNRDLGVSDEFVGLYYEAESKRMLNEPYENKCFGWEETTATEEKHNNSIPF